LDHCSEHYLGCVIIDGLDASLEDGEGALEVGNPGVRGGRLGRKANGLFNHLARAVAMAGASFALDRLVGREWLARIGFA